MRDILIVAIDTMTKATPMTVGAGQQHTWMQEQENLSKKDSRMVLAMDTWLTAGAIFPNTAIMLILSFPSLDPPTPQMVHIADVGHPCTKDKGKRYVGSPGLYSA